jgi:hypothetical protein
LNAAICPEKITDMKEVAGKIFKIKDLWAERFPENSME